MRSSPLKQCIAETPSEIGSRLENAGFEVVESAASGVFHVAKSKTMVTLIITDAKQVTLPERYVERKRVQIILSTWEASRWLKKY